MDTKDDVHAISTSRDQDPIDYLHAKWGRVSLRVLGFEDLIYPGYIYNV